MIVTLSQLRQTNRNEQDKGVTVGNHYYATLGHTNADVVPLVQQFDNRLRRDQWVQYSRLAGSDIEVRPVTARQADSLTRRLVHRLDRYLLQALEYEPLSDMKDEYYLRRNPFCHHDSNYDAPLSTVNGSYRPYLQWRESNTWEHEVWYWWVPLASAADRMLAEKFRNHLSELHSRGNCRDIQRMTAEIKWFTIPEVNLMAETGDSQNWYPRYSHSDMNDNIRLRLNKAIETTDSKEFVDIAYKMGLFLPEGEDD